MLARTPTRKIAATGAVLLLTTAGAAAAAAARTGDQQNGANSEAPAHHHDTHGVHATQARHGRALKVTLRGVEGQRVGVVSLRRAGDVLVVSGLTWGLTPGFHGFHIHTTGLCEADAPAGPFSTAGGHFDVGAGHTHGDHAGDMPSLLVTENGRAYARFITDRFTLAQLSEGDGSAVMVHQDRDNFANIPERYTSGGVAGPDDSTKKTGDAGTRAACGVID
jgi:superoxide dismutase, Cu-Zn family